MPLICGALTWKKNKKTQHHASSHKDWHMPAGVSEAAWLRLFKAVINGRLSWWHTWWWQQQKPQTVANPSSSHYHRCMRGATLPFLPDLSLGTFRGWTKMQSSICKHLALWDDTEGNKPCWWLCLTYVVTLSAVRLAHVRVCVGFLHWNITAKFILWLLYNLDKQLRLYIIFYMECMLDFKWAEYRQRGAGYTLQWFTTFSSYTYYYYV